MPITANVTNEQITASVGETKIDVSVSGGVGPTGSQGPTGPAGAAYTLPVATASVLGGVKIGSGISIDGSGVISVTSASVAWADITGKPSTFTPSAHTHGGGDISFTFLSNTFTAADNSAIASFLWGVDQGDAGHLVDNFLKISLDNSYAAVSHAHSAADITSGTVATARLGSGTASSSTFLRGDGTWASAGSTNASDLTTGTLAYARMADPTVTSPSQITANQNDYASFARGINRFSTNGAYNLTGMAAGNDGEVRVLTNVGTTAANTLTIKDQSSSSTAANRFAVPWAGDCVIPNGASVVCYYDNTTSRWRVIA